MAFSSISATGPASEEHIRTQMYDSDYDMLGKHVRLMAAATIEDDDVVNARVRKLYVPKDHLMLAGSQFEDLTRLWFIDTCVVV